MTARSTEADRVSRAFLTVCHPVKQFVGSVSLGKAIRVHCVRAFSQTQEFARAFVPCCLGGEAQKKFRVSAAIHAEGENSGEIRCNRPACGERLLVVRDKGHGSQKLYASRRAQNAALDLSAQRRRLRSGQAHHHGRARSSAPAASQQRHEKKLRDE